MALSVYGSTCYNMQTVGGHIFATQQMPRRPLCENSFMLRFSLSRQAEIIRQTILEAMEGNDMSDQMVCYGRSQDKKIVLL